MDTRGKKKNTILCHETKHTKHTKYTKHTLTCKLVVVHHPPQKKRKTPQRKRKTPQRKKLHKNSPFERHTMSALRALASARFRTAA